MEDFSSICNEIEQKIALKTAVSKDYVTLIDLMKTAGIEKTLLEEKAKLAIEFIQNDIKKGNDFLQNFVYIAHVSLAISNFEVAKSCCAKVFQYDKDFIPAKVELLRINFEMSGKDKLAVVNTKHKLDEILDANPSSIDALQFSAELKEFKVKSIKIQKLKFNDYPILRIAAFSTLIICFVFIITSIF